MRSAAKRSLAIAAVASVGGCGWVTYKLIFYNPPADWAQHVVPHGPLVELAPNLWQVTGRVDAHSDSLMRNMVIFRMPRPTPAPQFAKEDNRPQLLLHSVISLSDEGMNEIDKLGKVRYILVPSPFHRLDAAVYKQRYPDAEVICPQDIRSRVSKVVPVDATVENVFHRRDASAGIKCYVPGDGLYIAELVYELPLEKKEASQEGPTTEKALVFCDLLTNVKSGPLNVRALGIVTGGEYPVVPWFARYVASRDNSKMKRFWEALAQRNDISVLAMAHGEPVVGPAEVKKRLKKIAADY